jgi:uncharacterized protein (TIGR03790 family)
MIRLVAMVMLLIAPTAARALEPDELLLVVNKNVPVGRQLAEFYAQQRHVPEGRIVAVDMPGADECTINEYEKNVVPVVRDFMRTNHLENRVRCLVTFLGLPLRIANRKLSDDEQREVDHLQLEARQADEVLANQVKAMEALAGQLDPNFIQAADGTSFEDYSKRVDAALGTIRVKARTIEDPQLKQQIGAKLQQNFQMMGGRVRFYDELYPLVGHRAGISQQERDQWEQIGAAVNQAKADVGPLLDKKYDPAAREQLKQVVKDNFGLLTYDRLLHDLLNYFSLDDTQSAFDSELSLLWLNFYPRAKWAANPMYYEVSNRAGMPGTLMVCRLDAPEEGQVRNLIVAGLKAEQEGLKGRIVCDSRGLTSTKTDDYARYDQTIRDLADLVRTKTKLELVADDKPEVLPANSVKDVALYVGWYSVRHYIPSCQFTAGAVGYHVASWELTSLRDPKNTGWCRGMLNDGIGATLGPVTEPYLMSFPRADDFFPLLMTGKLTLAEVYWRTERLSSWQMALIGDPLYTPYRTLPALKVEDLPARLRGALGPTTRPTTQPGW